MTLKNFEGEPVSYEPVELAVTTGAGLTFGDTEVEPGTLISIGQTDTNGVASALVKTTTSGTRTITARSSLGPISQTAEVTFIPGTLDAEKSSISAKPLEAPADGTGIAITVTARDANSNLIPGMIVSLSSDSPNATIVQPSTPTDAQGKTTGMVFDTTAEEVIISASIDGVPISGLVTVTFGSTDLTVELSGPLYAPPGEMLTYSVLMKNLRKTVADGVSLTLSLPEGLTYDDDDAPVDPEPPGSVVTWNLGSLPGYSAIAFTISIQSSESIAIGSDLTSMITVSSTSFDTNHSNNTSQATTRFGITFTHTATISPSSQTLSIGGEAVYTIEVQNTGQEPDTFTTSVSGINSDWFTVEPGPTILSPGQVIDSIPCGSALQNAYHHKRSHSR